MKNLEIAALLLEIGDLLDLAGADAFKVRAYRRAAQTMESLGEDVAEVYARGGLQGLPGVGKAMAGKVADYLEHGRIELLERLRAELPAGLKEMLHVPGMGVRTVALLYRRLGIASLDELEVAVRARRLRELPGMGPKKEGAILAGLLAMRRRAERAPLFTALPLANELAAQLSRLPGVSAAAVTGSIRRRRELVGDIDLVAASREPRRVVAAFAALPQVTAVVLQEEDRCTVETGSGRRAKLRVVAPEAYPAALIWFTGSAAHQARLVERAGALGLTLSDRGLFAAGGAPVPADDEAAIYRCLGLDFVPPELREDRGEVAAAAAGALPRLIDTGDIRGDLHSHTHWSDGTASLAEMAAAARRRGYAYLAVCDHSQSLTVAGGLSPERLRQQGEEIARLNAGWSDFRLLRGVEVDILKDGSLDLPDAVLAAMDVVVASVHSGFRMDGESMTARIVRALQNPHVDILGHATGRLLGRRDGYAVNLEQVLAAAQQTGTAVEINASPDRLDIDDVWAYRARTLGIRLAVNTDAHAADSLGDIGYGIGQARRAWLQPGDVINTMELADLLAYLHNKA